MKYTKKQHYLSRYILNRFLNSKGKIDAVLMKPMKKIVADSKDICAEKDFYEDKTNDGEYINRNCTENKFAAMESEMANKVDELHDILEAENYNCEIRCMCINGKWDELSCYLMLHLTLIMVRCPKFKELIFKKDEMSLEIKQLLYKEYMMGKEEAKILATNQFKGVELEGILNSIDNSKLNGCINELMNKLINNYFVEIYKTPTGKKFFLSDNPVLVNEIEGIDYFVPISSDFAIVLKRFTKDGKFLVRDIPVASETMVDGINKLIIKNATNFVIAQDMTDVDFEFIKLAKI